jgi:hypothetical protein
MAKADKPLDPARLLRQLQDTDELRHVDVVPAGLEPRLALLRGWQSERLATTYADLLADPRTRPAGLFFLSDIYGPHDFTQRDHDAERLHEILSRLIPAPMLQQLTDVIALNRLSAALDQQMVTVLCDQLGVTDAITGELYAEAYRRCDNRAERERQIDLIVKVLKEAAQGARWPGAGLALKVIQGPAKKAGWTELYAFLEHGQAAFKRIRDVKAFVATVERRERRILEQIFASQADPFAIGEAPPGASAPKR